MMVEAVVVSVIMFLFENLYLLQRTKSMDFKQGRRVRLF
jgi:hypothetical protein